MSAKAYAAGVESHRLEDTEVRIYNVEKTIADCFKYRNKIGLDVALEALRAYRRQPGFNITSLLHYARIDRVERVIRPYLEALV
jgi:predicted transcriptional regulator of viral defense system